MELRRGDEVRVEVGRYPFPTVVGEGGTGGEWFDSVRRALRWNTRGAVQGGFGQRVNMGELDVTEEEPGAYGETYDGDLGLEEEEEEKWDIDAEPLDDGENWSVAGSVTGGGSEAGSVAHGSPSRRKSSAWILD